MSVARSTEIVERSIVINLEPEGVQQRRVVHIDGVGHPAELAPSLLGHSIGPLFFPGRRRIVQPVAEYKS
jgi:hypothetical protein